MFSGFSKGFLSKDKGSSKPKKEEITEIKAKPEEKKKNKLEIPEV